MPSNPLHSMRRLLWRFGLLFKIQSVVYPFLCNEDFIRSKSNNEKLENDQMKALRSLGRKPLIYKASSGQYLIGIFLLPSLMVLLFSCTGELNGNNSIDKVMSIVFMLAPLFGFMFAIVALTISSSSARLVSDLVVEEISRRNLYLCRRSPDLAEWMVTVNGVSS